MSVQGQLLDITVIGCGNLKDTEWISRQDPYVILEYAGNRYRTKTDTDGGRNPTFNEKYMLPLIEGLREVNVTVWNSNTLSADDFIGSGKILLQKVLTEGFHDSTWPLTTRNGKRAGEVRIIMHYASPPKGKQNGVPSTCAHHEPPYAPPYPPVGYTPYSPYGSGGYPLVSSYGVQPPPGTYPPQVNPLPQAYPPPQAYPQVYPPQQGYGAPPPGAYPAYPAYPPNHGSGWTR